MIASFPLIFISEHGAVPDEIAKAVLPSSDQFPSFYPTDAYVHAPEVPDEENYRFDGWYDSVSFLIRFDFTQILRSPKIAYGKWIALSSSVDWHGNRSRETFTFTRVGFGDWMEHEDYPFITTGSVEFSSDTDLKVTGNFSFEGSELPKTDDLLRVKYTFEDSNHNAATATLGTFVVSYAGLTHRDSKKGIVSSGTIDGKSVLSILQEKVIGTPRTIKAGSQAVFEAEQLIRECGLFSEADTSSFTLTVDHTFDAGTDYLELVNWLLNSASFREAYPNPDGVIELRSVLSQGERVTFVNDRKSIIYPEIDAQNDWQNTPNVVRLLYNTDEDCAMGYAVNELGSRASLSARGGREITYFEEVSDLGLTDSIGEAIEQMAIDILKEKSSDVEYVTLEHAYKPVYIFDTVELRYSDMTWEGQAVNITVDLEPSVPAQTKLKRELSAAIIVSSGHSIFREVDE